MRKWLAIVILLGIALVAVVHGSVSLNRAPIDDAVITACTKKALSTMALVGMFGVAACEQSKKCMVDFDALFTEIANNFMVCLRANYQV